MAEKRTRSPGKSATPAAPRAGKGRGASNAKGKAKTKARPARRSLPRRILGFAAKWTAVAAVWALIVGGGALAWFAADLPDIDAALAAGRRPIVTVVDRTGAVLAASGDLYAGPVRAADLPPALPQAVIATEDRRFYDHLGIDPLGIARAAIANWRAGAMVQGGSTITQQVAKNLFLTPDRTLKRKIQEAMLAVWLEQKFTKDQILTLYFNRVYLGAGTYGVEAAAWKYFGRSARELGLYESALLAGLLKAPSRYNPLNDPDLAAARARQVLANMVDAGYLPPAAAELALADPRWRRAGPSPGGRRAPWFVDWVLDQVPDFARPDDTDLTVITTLDSTLQREVEARTAALMAAEGAKAAASQAAVVVMDTDGAIRALVGGADYGNSQFNRAVQARRQPGSAFKPFVYLAALESGRTPDSVVDDAPLRIGTWQPANFENTYEGPVTLRHALAESINTVAIRLSRAVGPDHIIRTARRLGIGGALPEDLTIALGTGSVSPVELTAAFAPFANGGMGVWPHAVVEIRDGAGNTLYRRAGGGPGRVVDAELVAQMNSMMTGVIQGGTGKAAALDRPAAGKTGTSQDFRDAWFVGYTADRVAAVWMGNDNGAPMKHVTGGGLPAQLWQQVMTAANQGLPARPLPGLDRPWAIAGPAPSPAAAPAPASPPASSERPGFWDRLLTTLGGG